jgi:hypothetical protein
MMSNGYEYAKANMLQSLENARIYTSYMGETDDEMRWKLDEDIAAFKQKIEQLLKEYEQQHTNQG